MSAGATRRDDRFDMDAASVNRVLAVLEKEAESCASSPFFNAMWSRMAANLRRDLPS